GLIEPDALVSVARLPELQGIRNGGHTLHLGAAVTLREVSSHPDVRRRCPSLAHACAVVGNPRIRNVATIGGNLAEADYASDPPSVLASLGAVGHIAGPGDRRRTVPVSGFVTGYFQTVLEEGEVLTHVDVPVEPARRVAYLKYRSRSSEDRACVGVAARLDPAGDDHARVGDLDVVVAAVASTPQRVPAALDAARGERFDASLAREVASAYGMAIRPLDDGRGSAWYRSRMIEVFVRRAVESLLPGEEERGDA
ncbi:MAG: FAD binding domain-containing protein, partial [Ilumatobacteraceae bacterium]